MEHLQTARLQLVPYSPTLIRTAIASKPALERLLSVRIPADWPSPDYAWFLPFIAGRLAREPSKGIWDRLMIHTRDRTLIGHIGFKGGPDIEGAADLGYAIVPGYRGQGLATEAGEAMLRWAFLHPAVVRLKATCHHENGPSIRVLARLGFQRRGELGSDLLWERFRDPAEQETDPPMPGQGE